MSDKIEAAQTFAVVVGVEKYAIGEKWNLDGPASDAIRFVQWLREKKEVPAKNIHLFLSPLDINRDLLQQVDVKPNLAEEHLLRKVLTNDLADAAGRGKLLFLFWGGHGVIETDQDRRLFCGDATDNNKTVINLDSLLKMLRTKPWSGFVRQIGIVDACANYFEEMRHKISLPNPEFGTGPPSDQVEQSVLFAAAAGQLAKNQTTRKTGAFSECVLEALAQDTSGLLPPDTDSLFVKVRAHFKQLRQRGELRQNPVLFQWKLADNEGSDGDSPLSGLIQEAAGRAGLGIGQLRALAALILRSSDLAAETTRKYFGTRLTAEVGEAVPLPTDTPEADLIGMLATAFRSSNGITVLLRLLPDYISKTAVLCSVEHGVERLRSVAAIWELLRDVPIKNQDLQKLYKLSSPDPQQAPEASDLDGVVEALWQMAPRRSGDIHPLFEFVERTARRFDRPDLSQWVEDNAPNRGLVTDLREALDQEEAAAARRFNYLLVDVPGPAPERLRYWVLDEGFSCKIQDEVACDRSSTGLRAALTKILNKVEAAAVPELVVELFVPREMMSCDADQWELAYGLPENPRIGELYPVLLRWRDRAERAEGTRAGIWERVSEQLRKHVLQNTNAPSALWIGAKDGPGVELINKLGRGNYGKCVGFLFVPIDEQARERGSLLDFALLGGMPFGFWLRREPPDWKVFQTELDNLLTAGQLDDVPHQLKEFRLHAAADEQRAHPGCCFTLFWDDPARNPLGEQLETIGQRAQI